MQAALVYNLLRKVLSDAISDCPQLSLVKRNKHHNLGRGGCLFLFMIVYV